jgi:putative hydrolase of the HAD superfamily
MSIKVITIDFWNTLFDSSNGLERNKYRLGVLIKETDKIGYNIKFDDLEPIMQSSWEYFNDMWMNNQRTPSSCEIIDFFWNQLELSNNKETKNKIAGEFENSILLYPPKIMIGVKNALKTLSKNFKLGIISDTGFSPGSVLKKILKKEDILKYFHAFSFSNETGVSKPHLDAFNKIFNDLGIKPKEVLHIGDIESTDIIGAKNAGMKAILFQGNNIDDISYNNSLETKADAKCSSWNEIIIEIKKLNSK